MTYFKNIKHFNCSLDFNLTHLLICYPPMLLWRSELFFSLTDDIDVASASKYVAGKHRILTTMNISGGRVIHTVIVLCLPLPSV